MPARGRIERSLAMNVTCPKCGVSSPNTARFCTRCHFPLRFVCPACAHVQDRRDTCEACGVDFVKYAMARVAQITARSEREAARMQKRSAVFREVILAVLTGGLSLLKYLRPRR